MTMRTFAYLEQNDERLVGTGVRLCRLYCQIRSTGQTWRWESFDRTARSTTTFDMLYHCAEDARRAGFTVDLVVLPIVEE